MNRIEEVWHLILTQMENISFVQPQEFSPYMELPEAEWNRKAGNHRQIVYNGMYRFAKILGPLFESTCLSQDDQAWLNDILVHALLQTESHNGVSKKEYQTRKKMREIGQGDYGSEVKECFSRLDIKKKYRIAEGLFRQEKIGESVELFGEMCSSVLENSVLYKNTIDAKTLLLSCNQGISHSQHYTEEITILKQLFLPLEYEVFVFSDKSIGVLGEDVTMRTDNLMLF